MRSDFSLNFSTTDSAMTTGSYFEYGIFKTHIAAPVDICRCCAAVPHTPSSDTTMRQLGRSVGPYVA